MQAFAFDRSTTDVSRIAGVAEQATQHHAIMLRSIGHRRCYRNYRYINVLCASAGDADVAVFA